MSERDPIEYLINEMEDAAHRQSPAAYGYADKRRAVLSAITTLRARAERLEAENLSRGNALGRIAVHLLGRQNNVSDEHVVTAAAAVGRELQGAKIRAERLEAALRGVDTGMSRILHEMAGAVSLCWEPRPHGVFQSSQACEFVAAAIAEIRAPIGAALADPAPGGQDAEREGVRDDA